MKTTQEILDFIAKHQETGEYGFYGHSISLEKEIVPIWCEQLGIPYPGDFHFGIANSEFFKKTNSQKHEMNGHLLQLQKPIVETFDLGTDEEEANRKAEVLYNRYRGGVIRARKAAAASGTFILKSKKDIKEAIKHCLGLNAPMFSPYYDAEFEYGCFVINGKLHTVVVKHRNPENGMHNLSHGAKSTFFGEEHPLFNELQEICSGLYEKMGMGFGRVDIMHTEEGMKIVELSVPNFKRFSIYSPENFDRAKEMFYEFYKSYYLNK